MARITVEDCLRRENNRFTLVVLASRRAKQLLRGAKSLLPEVKNKPIVTALREIAQGGVRFMTPEELAKVKAAESEQYADDQSQQAIASAVAAADELFFSKSHSPEDLEAEFKAEAEEFADDDDEDFDDKEIDSADDDNEDGDDEF